MSKERKEGEEKTSLVASLEKNLLFALHVATCFKNPRHDRVGGRGISLVRLIDLPARGTKERKVIQFWRNKETSRDATPTGPKA